jgi:hypothetical protein
MDVELLYSVPGFVKEAGETALDISIPGSVVVGGFRLDNPAAVWYAAASLRKQAMEDPTRPQSPILTRLIKEACELFDINDSHFKFAENNYESFLVKEAGHSAEFIIGGQEDFEQAVHAVLAKRASAPYSFCKACAAQLNASKERNGYTLSKEASEALDKMEGKGTVSFRRGAIACHKRADYAELRGMKTEADILRKFAAACETSTDERIIPLVIDGLDEFDRHSRCINKYASDNIKHPETYFYMTEKETVAELAKSKMELDGVSINRGKLMNSDTLSKIASWTEDCGYNVGAQLTPEAVIDTVKSMPDSLREEFIETFVK